MKILRIRAGSVILNHKNEILLIFRKGKWDLPKGKVPKKGKLLSVAINESIEETGIKKKHIKIILESKNWINYDLPKELIPKLWNGKFVGQSQKWFAMEFLGSDSDVNINTKNPEFSKWQWMTKNKLLDSIVPFKKRVYENILSQFSAQLNLK